MWSEYHSNNVKSLNHFEQNFLLKYFYVQKSFYLFLYFVFAV